MAKLSQIVNKLQAYIDLHGDKDVTSIGTCSGSGVEYTFNLHDIHTGSIGTNPYTGADKIEIMKDSAGSGKGPIQELREKELGLEDQKTVPESQDTTAKALCHYRVLEEEVASTEGMPFSNKMLMLWGALSILNRMGLFDEHTMHKMWNEFALKQLDVKE